MKIKSWVIVICLTGFVACNRDPATLSKDQYMDIILDLQVAETIILNSIVSNKDSLRQAIQTRIGEIYGFKDVEELKASLMPLEKDPELMLEITKAINKKLDQMEDSIKMGVD